MESVVSAPEQAEPRVSFKLDPDGKHFAWWHECRSDSGRWWFAETGWDVGGLLPLGPRAWTVQQADPVTLTPSILCRKCGLHGFITDGVWRAV